jgi:two-component system nitrate/nitrite response regulator NarL
MPGLNGLEILERLRSQAHSVAVVMVTTSRDENDVATALKRGARGYLLKDMEPDDLYAALLSIKLGGTVVAPELAVTLARVLQGLNANKQADRLADLTPREKEILRYIAEGGSNKVIGRALGITDGTVKLHVKAILRKLDVHSRVEAAVIAVERGLGRR